MTTLPHQARRILIIKFLHIGDVLLTAPLITTLKQAHSDNYVAIAVKPGTEAVIRNHPDLDAIYTLPEKQASESSISYLFRYLRWVFKIRRDHFDTAINTTKGDHGILLSFLSGASTRISMVQSAEKEKKWRLRLLTHPVPPIIGHTHAVLRNLNLARPITDRLNYTVQLRFERQQLDEVQQLLQSSGYHAGSVLIHLHPTSRWLFKCWKDEYMATVIDWLQTTPKATVVLTSAPSEGELSIINRILTLCRTEPINLAGKLSLPQLAAISSISDLFFGVDSAPMHIAAAQETPTVALFGPSRGYEWGPWPNEPTSETPYRAMNGIQHVGSHTIIQQSWECVPCSQSGCNRSKKSECLDELHPDTVIPILKDRIVELTGFQQQAAQPDDT